MDIEEEIKKEISENEYHKLGINILFTSGWINLQRINFFRHFDISPQQFNVLKILKGECPDPVTLNQIIDKMIDKSSNVSRLVEKLRAKGFLVRKQCENNRRAVDIIITQKGLELLEEIERKVVFEDIFKTLTIEEAVQLNFLLNKLRNRTE
jgi:DNA-binding MarR family transcriptional regulator